MCTRLYLSFVSTHLIAGGPSDELHGLFQAIGQHESVLLSVDEFTALLSNLKNGSNCNVVLDLMTVLLEAYQGTNLTKLTSSSGI